MYDQLVKLLIQPQQPIQSIEVTGAEVVCG
jgi:hypothetical protein